MRAAWQSLTRYLTSSLPRFYRKHTSQTLSRNARNLSLGAAFQGAGGDYSTQINCSPANISGVSTHKVRVTLLSPCPLLSD